MEIITPEEKLAYLSYRGFHPTEDGRIDDYCNELYTVYDFCIKNLTPEDIERIETKEEIQALFEKDSVIEEEYPFGLTGETWDNDFVGEGLRYIDIQPDALDPFIARYVGAINNVGIQTIDSCDGWHAKGNTERVYITFAGKYSYIWHKLLCEDDSMMSFGSWEHSPYEVQMWLPEDDAGKLSAYDLINKKAQEYEQKLEGLVLLKEAIIAKTNAMDIDMEPLSDEEVEEHFREVLELVNEARGY